MASNPQQQQYSMSSPSPLVWFQLLDAANDLPYKGTFVSSILRSSLVVPVIDQFRDAVKKKDKDDGYAAVLTPFKSSQLFVYKNKTVFDKRNAAVDDRKEEPLEEDSLLDGLGKSKKEALIVVVPSPTISPELDQLEQEIKVLENSEEYKTLAYKNRAWAHPKPTEQEKGEWQLLKEKLADLKQKEDFYQKAILSTNAHSVKKSDKTRKGYKKDTAIKDESLLLSDVAITMWERFGYTLEHNGKPTFGDFMRAAGFKNDGDVRDFFRKKAKGEVKQDDIKESFTNEAWIWLIGLNQRVNPLLHDKLITNQDGSLRLVLEHDIYEDGAGMAENVVRTLYGPEKKVEIKDALSDSSTSQVTQENSRKDLCDALKLIKEYFETERDFFCVGDECVVYQMRITDSKEGHQLLEKVYAMCMERPAIDSTSYGETGEDSKQIVTNVEQRDC